ncbi:MAG: hypothetical protein ACOYJD_08055 [Christensenellales bacterium]|jgi:hypothetical protein
MYDAIRKRTTDIEHIARNTPFTKKAIGEIKDHIFYNEHRFGDDSARRFDPDFEQTQAWDRLTQGKHTQLDIMLLKHEYAELMQMQLRGHTYGEAHDIATPSTIGPWL